MTKNANTRANIAKMRKLSTSVSKLNQKIHSGSSSKSAGKKK